MAINKCNARTKCRLIIQFYLQNGPGVHSLHFYEPSPRVNSTYETFTALLFTPSILSVLLRHNTMQGQKRREERSGGRESDRSIPSGAAMNSRQICPCGAVVVLNGRCCMKERASRKGAARSYQEEVPTQNFPKAHSAATQQFFFFANLHVAVIFYYSPLLLCCTCQCTTSQFVHKRQVYKINMQSFSNSDTLIPRPFLLHPVIMVNRFYDK